MTDRIESLDTLKGFALLCVVYIHSMPFFSQQVAAELVSYFFATVSRVGVPAFFLTSGYLTSKKLGDDQGRSFVKKQMKRIGKVYVAASLIYLPVLLGLKYINRYLNLGVVTEWVTPSVAGLEAVINLLFIGKYIAPFLWFLPALFFSLGLVYLFNSREMLKELLIGSAVLHLLAVISNVYLVFEWLPIPWESAASVGLFFTVTGFYIGKRELKEAWESRGFLWLTAALLLLHFGEHALISLTVPRWEAYYWNPYFWGTYSFFTAPLVVSLFIYILKNPGMGRDSRFNLYGKYTLTGYILHPAVVGTYAGLSVAVTAVTGVPILNTLAWNLLIFPLAYLTTMETVVWYRNR